MMEESQNEFLEKLDHAAQLREEDFLRDLLGSDTIKEEPDEDLPHKPRGQRKTKEDLQDWAETVYYGQWEVERLFDDILASPLGNDAQ